MSTSLRSLFVIGFLFAGMTGCASEDDCDDETPEEHAAHTQDDKNAQAEVEASKLAIQKKVQLTRKAESPKK